MGENEDSGAGVDGSTVTAKKPAKTDSRALYSIKIGLITVALFASAYVVVAKSILALLSSPMLGVPG
jgi:hypothetical protein